MSTAYNVVFGCPRSGTTFLMTALSGLPNSETVTGMIYPPHIAHLVNQGLADEWKACLGRGLQFSLDAYLERCVNWRFWGLYRLFRGDIGLKEVWPLLRQRRTVGNIIYKEPFLAFSPEFVYESIPDVKIIYLYRDGRDSADSLVRTYAALADEKLENLDALEVALGSPVRGRFVPWWVERGREEEFLACSPFVRNVWMWKEMVNRCQNFFRRPDIADSCRVLTVKYEELMSDPLTQGERIVGYLEQRMTRTLRKRFAAAHTRSIGVHKRRPTTEIEAANRIAAVELELCGYR
jgi:hypothetical protein